MIFLTDILVTIPEKVVGQPTEGMPEGKRVKKDEKDEEIVHIKLVFKINLALQNLNLQ